MEVKITITHDDGVSEHHEKTIRDNKDVLRLIKKALKEHEEKFVKLQIAN